MLGNHHPRKIRSKQERKGDADYKIKLKQVETDWEAYKKIALNRVVVLFEGKKTKLTPLTREIYRRKGKIRKSGSFQGASHWGFDGWLLVDID